MLIKQLTQNISQAFAAGETITELFFIPSLTPVLTVHKKAAIINYPCIQQAILRAQGQG